MTCFVRYRVGTNPTPQCAKMQASGPNELRKLIEAQYPGQKIQFVNGPTSSASPPSWYKA